MKLMKRTPAAALTAVLPSVLTAVMTAVMTASLSACSRDSQPVPQPVPQPNPQPKTGDLSSGPGPAGMGDSVNKAENIAGDTAITAKIKVELLKAPDLKSTEISVDTTDGRVTLTGTVPEPQQIQQAANIVRGVEGVRNVDNKLIVKSPS